MQANNQTNSWREYLDGTPPKKLGRVTLKQQQKDKTKYTEGRDSVVIIESEKPEK